MVKRPAYPIPERGDPGQMQTKAWLLFQDHPCPPPCWTPYQKCQHLEHGDLGIAKVGEEVNEGRDTQPVAEAGTNGCAHQGALPLWGKGST